MRQSKSHVPFCHVIFPHVTGILDADYGLFLEEKRENYQIENAILAYVKPNVNAIRRFMMTVQNGWRCWPCNYQFEENNQQVADVGNHHIITRVLSWMLILEVLCAKWQVFFLRSSALHPTCNCLTKAWLNDCVTDIELCTPFCAPVRCDRAYIRGTEIFRCKAKRDHI